MFRCLFAQCRLLFPRLPRSPCLVLKGGDPIRGNRVCHGRSAGELVCTSERHLQHRVVSGAIRATRQRSGTRPIVSSTRRKARSRTPQPSACVTNSAAAGVAFTSSTCPKPITPYAVSRRRAARSRHSLSGPGNNGPHRGLSPQWLGETAETEPVRFASTGGDVDGDVLVMAFHSASGLLGDRPVRGLFPTNVVRVGPLDGVLPRCPFGVRGEGDQGTRLPGRIIRPSRLRPWSTATVLNGALRARLAQKGRRP